MVCLFLLKIIQMNENKNIIILFEALAEHYEIPVRHGWKTMLIQKIGKQIDVKNSDLIITWNNRGYIPDLSLEKILKLDIPESIKELCLKCKKPPKAKQEKIEIMELTREEIIKLLNIAENNSSVAAGYQKDIQGLREEIKKLKDVIELLKKQCQSTQRGLGEVDRHIRNMGAGSPK